MLPISNRRDTRSLHFFKIRDQILNGTDLEPPLLSKLQTSISAHHSIVPPDLCDAHGLFAILYQFRDHSRRAFSRQTTELNGSLSVAFSHTDTATTSLEW